MPTAPAMMAKIMVDDYSEALGSSVIRTQMDAGPAKTRRRFSSAPSTIQGSSMWTTQELNDFLTWFKNDLQDGALSFDMPHPRTKVQGIFRYIDTEIPIVPGNRASTRWRVQHQLEHLS